MVQSAAAYAVFSWIIIEVSSVILPAFEAPPIALKSVIGLVVLGFPIVLIISWVFDFTSKGFVRTAEIQSDDEIEADDDPQAKAVRRQLTVLCVKIRIIHQGDDGDPEDLLKVQPRVLQLARKIFDRFEGSVVPSRAGELLAYFGYPVAHEDASRNAVRSALGILNAVRQFVESESVEPNININCCAAIHTGDVIVEESVHEGESEPTIIGVVPDEAVELLDHCTTGEVLISEKTYRNVKGFFEVSELDEKPSGAGAARRKFYRVLLESGAHNRLEAQSEEDLLPLIGRDLELSQLQQHWRRVLDGQGQVVLVTGSPGIGKSRLSRAFKESVAENPQAWLTELFCEPFSKNTALHPIIEFFRQILYGPGEQESSPEGLSQIEGLLAEYSQNLAETVPLFAAMLNVPLSDKYAPLSVSPQRHRQEIMELVVNIFIMRASRQPLLFVVEDMHWADPTTLELLGLLVDQVPAQQIMCVFTFRTPFQPNWGFASHISQLNLAGLETKAALDVCASITSKLPPEVVEQVAAKADGVPLFIEEVTRSLVESGEFETSGTKNTKKMIETLIPATLKDVLAARLDALGKARSIAQLGATIGRDFQHELIAEVGPQVKTKHVEDGLQKLIEPEIVYKKGTGVQASYRFKHALMQDAAYQSLIKKHRKVFHTAIAKTLENKFPELVASNLETLAHHYTVAEQHEKAIDYSLKAANQAMVTASTAEAISHLRNGLDIAAELPAGFERNLKELLLQTALGSASMFAYGYASPEAHDAYSKAEKLCGPEIDLQFAVPVVMGLSAYHSVRGAAIKGQNQNKRILAMAKQTQDSDLLLWAHAFTCVGNFYEGKFDQTDSHLEEVLNRYEFEKHRGLSIATSQDPKVFALLHSAQSMWALGFSDQAVELVQKKDKLAKQLDHPLVLQQALGWGNVIYLYLRKPELLVEKARKAYEIALEQNIPFYIGGNRVWWGAGLAQQGNHKSGVKMMREGLEILHGTGAQIGRPMMHALVAQSLGALGQQDEAQQEISAALKQIERWGERFYLAEIHRISGDLYLQQADPVNAEESYRKAIEVARTQSAKGWELKAATSLAVLLKDQGRQAEAAAILGELVDWFTEGLATQDLEDARVLLAGIS